MEPVSAYSETIMRFTNVSYRRLLTMCGLWQVLTARHLCLIKHIGEKSGRTGVTWAGKAGEDVRVPYLDRWLQSPEQVRREKTCVCLTWTGDSSHHIFSTFLRADFSPICFIRHSWWAVNTCHIPRMPQLKIAQIQLQRVLYYGYIDYIIFVNFLKSNINYILY